ncbi:hypothetical protein [Pedobacter sp. MW01-1-1]|uniref:hypothetical protein n=1 Tax=Pedobacter sp. MW01-1-1 TaxID=3383027 RepID=UPI003FEF400A
MRYSCLLFFLVYSFIGFAQKKFIFPKIQKQGKTLNDFIPQDWILLQRAEGDLNQDNQNDFAFILEYKQSISESRAYGDNSSKIVNEVQKPRILVIALKDKTKAHYIISMQSNDFILRESEGGKLGDPLEALLIKEHSLYLQFKGGSEWRWQSGYTFKLSKNEWQLCNAMQIYYNHNSGEMTERYYDFEERQLYSTYGNVYQRNIANVKTSEVLFFNGMRTFETFKKPWAWEIIPDVYL